MDDELLEWFEEVRKEIIEAVKKSKSGSSTEGWEGSLSHVKGKTSVQLQHEISKIRAEMVMNYKKKR